MALPVRIGEFSDSWKVSAPLTLQAHWKAIALMNNMEGLGSSRFLTRRLVESDDGFWARISICGLVGLPGVGFEGSKRTV